MTLDKLKPNMIVYDVSKHRGRFLWWPVIIVEIDEINKRVYARWNVLNKPEWYYERSWKKWRLKKPEDIIERD